MALLSFLDPLLALLAPISGALAWLTSLHPALLLAVLAFLGYAAYRAFRFLSHIVACAALFAFLAYAAAWLELAPPATLSSLISAATFGVLFFILYSAILGELTFLSRLLSPLQRKEKKRDEKE